MPAAQLSLLLCAPFFAVLAAFSAPEREEDERKCSNFIDTDIWYFVDGKAVSEEEIKANEAPVVAVFVTCLNPEDSTPIPSGSNTPGARSVVVWTASGPAAPLEAITTQLRDAQRAHFDTRGVYATSVEALALRDVPDGVRIQIDATPTRWRATVTLRRLHAPTCVVVDGDHTAPMPRPDGAVRCDHVKAATSPTDGD